MVLTPTAAAGNATPTSPLSQRQARQRFFIVAFLPFIMAGFAVIQIYSSFGVILHESEWMSLGSWEESLFASPEFLPTKTRVAYAVSITKCVDPENKNLFDGAAVLHQSIRQAHQTSDFDFQMIAFMHPTAEKNCSSKFTKLGYEVQIRDTPFNETEMQNTDLRKAQKNSCCGAKEYLKLYSWLQFQYPVVIHLDIDCMVLKPMDPLFHLLLNDRPGLNKSSIQTQWLNSSADFPANIGFAFTRDYNMVEPSKKQPRQIGVQGGFLVVRPNQTEFDRMVEIILQGGDFALHVGWGGRQKGYGGYYGAGTIQGLASYYYGEYERDRAVELNRCHYNTMVDNPYGSPKKNNPNATSLCRTLEMSCQDCRETPLHDVYTAHFTVCGKPNWCENHNYQRKRLCMDLMAEWHRARYSLEREWLSRDSKFVPAIDDAALNKTGIFFEIYHGHCPQPGRYKKMVFPDAFYNESEISPLILDV